MPQNLVKFMVLQFSRRFDNEAVKLLLVDSEDGRPLQVLIHPNWEQRVDHPADQAYLSEMMDEWKHTRPDRIPKLMEELCRQSQGPLRVLRQGHVEAAQFQSLIEEVTGNAK